MDERSFDAAFARDGYDFSKYSEGFRTMIAKHGLSTLLKDCHFDASFAEWEKGRRPAAEFITKPGSIIDFGCANGFLLACLEEWSGQKLDLYGVDVNTDAVAKAARLFGYTSGEHFVALSEGSMKLPQHFDYAYWNVWDNANFEDPYVRKVITWLRERTVGGRIILGFYHEETAENERKLQWFVDHGYVPTKVARTESGLIFAAIDIMPAEQEK